MSVSPVPGPPVWMETSSIPIRLEIREDFEREPRDGHAAHICQTCSVDSRRQPIHCIQVSSCSPAPPSYNSVVSGRSNNLAAPILSLQTSRGLIQPRPPRPALQFDVDRRPRVRFRRSPTVASPHSPCTTIHDTDHHLQARSSGASIPNTPQDEFDSKRRSKLGLGIPEVPFHPDPSPIRSPGSEGLARAEKGKSIKTASPNIAQRIEEKLLEYSQSGNIAKRWLLEIISWTLSALCMTAIIVVIYVYSGKPAPTNWPLGLTLNTYISILSKVASASLLLPASEALGQLKWSWFQGGSKKMWDFEIFDNASRGPWGSFLLLLRTKGTTLAALGAAITIFAMALDPFFQQLVHSPQHWVLLEEQSKIPIVTRYDPEFAKESVLNRTLINVNKDMQHVADQYFFDFGVPEVQVGNVTRPDIPISCPTNNCTWEPYETLGVCSECKDVADMLDFGCHQASLDWVRNVSAFVVPANGTMCGWFFNATGAKPTLMLGYQVDPVTNETREILTTRSLPLLTVLTKRPLFGGSINFKHIRNPLTDFVVVSPGSGSDDDKILESIFQGERPRAQECVLSMCVKKLESSYELSAYKETITDRVVNTTTGPFPWTTARVESSQFANAGQLFYFQNITITPPVSDSQENVTSYGVSNETAHSFIRVFDYYLPSFGIRESNTSVTMMKYKMNFEEFNFRQYTKNPWLAPNNVTDHMERLAISLTNAMRFSSNESFKGKAFSEESLVEVRWPWLSLPFGLLVLTFIFLAATIIRTSAEKDRVGVWKNSAIANIIYGLPDDHKQKLKASQVEGTPRTRAKMLNVRMLPTKDWRISGLFSPTPSKHKSDVVKHEQPSGWF